MSNHSVTVRTQSRIESVPGPLETIEIGSRVRYWARTEKLDGEYRVGTVTRLDVPVTWMGGNGPGGHPVGLEIDGTDTLSYRDVTLVR